MQRIEISVIRITFASFPFSQEFSPFPHSRSTSHAAEAVHVVFFFFLRFSHCISDLRFILLLQRLVGHFNFESAYRRARRTGRFENWKHIHHEHFPIYLQFQGKNNQFGTIVCNVMCIIIIQTLEVGVWVYNSILYTQ